MLCFHDMTFCSFYKNCATAKAGDCHRPMTPEVEKAAEQAKLPIAHFTTQPDCHVLVGG